VYRIAVVCLGNICRSPIADVVVNALLDEAGLSADVEVTSCGTGTWHVGEPMDARAAEVLTRSGYDARHHRAQHFGPDWHDHDLIFARFDGTPWRPSYVSRRFRQLAAQAGVPVITLHEGGRHTGVSLMHDADVRDDIRMREVGHSDRAVHARYNHVLDEAHRGSRRAGGGAGPA